MGLLVKGRRLWQKGSLLSREGCPFHSAHQGMQHDLSNIRVLLASPPGYKEPVGLLCSCIRQLRLVEPLPGDVLIVNKTLGSCNGGQCYNKNTVIDCCIRGHQRDSSCNLKPFNTATTLEPVSTNSSNAFCKPLSRIAVFRATLSLKYGSSCINSPPQVRRFCSAFCSWRRKKPLCIGRRLFFSAGNYKNLSNLGVASLEDSAFSSDAAEAASSPDCDVAEADSSPESDEAEAETNASSYESEEDFDFRNFPALTSSFFQNYEPPSKMQLKKRVTWQTTKKLFDTDSKLTVESIPQPKGRTYDFGLGDMFLKPPSLEAGARPQGGFDIDISVDECEAAPETPPRVLQSLPKEYPVATSHGTAQRQTACQRLAQFLKSD